MAATLHDDQHTLLIVSVAVLLTVRYVTDKSCTENQNTHFVSSNFLFRKSCRFYDIMWRKYCRAEQATDGNMAHAHCLLDT